MSAGVRSLLPYNYFRILKEPQNVYLVAALPPPYQRFYREWMGSEEKAEPVHWVPQKEEWVRNPETGEVKRHQNVPVQVEYPPEMHRGLWGGEGVIEGMVKKAKYRSPVPKFWIPNFYKTVVYSDILDKHLSLVATERALKLIDEHQGLDSYLLKNKAYDLKSLLALKLKRKLMLSLIDRDFSAGDLEKQNALVDKFKDYLIPREDAEWYGYSVPEAQTKYKLIQERQPVPIKWTVREKYLEEWRTKAESGDDPLVTESKQSTSWIKKLNPFSKPAEAP